MAKRDIPASKVTVYAPKSVTAATKLLVAKSNSREIGHSVRRSKRERERWREEMRKAKEHQRRKREERTHMLIEKDYRKKKKSPTSVATSAVLRFQPLTFRGIALRRPLRRRTTTRPSSAPLGPLSAISLTHLVEDFL